MDILFDTKLIKGYKSNAQIARVLTENWVGANSYCPRCGYPRLERFENNRPVADFFCSQCKNTFELKSKMMDFGNKVADGSYFSMIQRIESYNNPDFLLMTYDQSQNNVKDFMVIPKYFFTPAVIEKRSPLSENARRAGWVGCNILLNKIPKEGRIYVIKDGHMLHKDIVVTSLGKTGFLENQDLTSRGWVINILNCINRIDSEIFVLNDVYKFENALSQIYPSNKHIKDKIRQQLQILRDRGFIEFLGQGMYRKLI
ncbi:MAG: DpnI domain-containing protein [Clostridiaceae bacterium]